MSGASNLRHHWTDNNPACPPTLSIHENQGSYVHSTFDVAHDAGLSTAMYATKDKFCIYSDAWGDKISATPVINTSSTSALVNQFVADLTSQNFNYSFVHLRDPDTVGHASNWATSAWDTAIENVDGFLGQILGAIEGDPQLMNNTAVIVTADHMSQIHTPKDW